MKKIILLFAILLLVEVIFCDVIIKKVNFNRSNEGHIYSGLLIKRNSHLKIDAINFKKTKDKKLFLYIHGDLRIIENGVLGLLKGAISNDITIIVTGNVTSNNTWGKSSEKLYLVGLPKSKMNLIVLGNYQLNNLQMYTGVSKGNLKVVIMGYSILDYCFNSYPNSRFTPNGHDFSMELFSVWDKTSCDYGGKPLYTIVYNYGDNEWKQMGEKVEKDFYYKFEYDMDFTDIRLDNKYKNWYHNELTNETYLLNNTISMIEFAGQCDLLIDFEKSYKYFLQIMNYLPDKVIKQIGAIYSESRTLKDIFSSMIANKMRSLSILNGEKTCDFLDFSKRLYFSKKLINIDGLRFSFNLSFKFSSSEINNYDFGNDPFTLIFNSVYDNKKDMLFCVDVIPIDPNFSISDIKFIDKNNEYNFELFNDKVIGTSSSACHFMFTVNSNSTIFENGFDIIINDLTISPSIIHDEDLNKKKLYYSCQLINGINQFSFNFALPIKGNTSFNELSKKIFKVKKYKISDDSKFSSKYGFKMDLTDESKHKEYNWLNYKQFRIDNYNLTNKSLFKINDFVVENNEVLKLNCDLDNNNIYRIQLYLNNLMINKSLFLLPTNDNNDWVIRNDKNMQRIISNSKDIKIYLSDIFDLNEINNLNEEEKKIFFNSQVQLKVDTAHLISNSFFHSKLIPEKGGNYYKFLSDLSAIDFEEIFNIEKNFSSLKKDIYIYNFILFFYPMRAIATNVSRDMDTMILDFVFKPVDFIPKDDMYKIVIPYDDSKFNPDSLNLKKNDSVLSWSFTNGYYESPWVKSGYNIKLLKENYINGYELLSSIDVEKEIAIYIYYISDDFDNKVNYRKNIIDIGKKMIITLNPEDIFKFEDQIIINEPVRFTKDVYIPSDCSLRFGKGAKLITDNITLDNNMHIVVDGKLEVISENPKEKYIKLGASGIDEKTDKISLIPHWGGIIVLPDGSVTLNGADISGALDGLILYENSNQCIIKDSKFHNNEIGIHIYNSNHSFDDTVIFQNNYLYDIKSDSKQ